MSRPAIIAGSVKLPIELVNVDALKKAMTITYSSMGVEEPVDVLNYRLEKDYIAVPRQFGISFCKREGIELNDQTSLGVKVKFPKTPTPYAYQLGPLKEVETCLNSYYDFIFRARTGWGKTIGSLLIAARFSVSTLIVVDQENLKEQWIDSLVRHFGFTREDIGLIQGKKCTHEGKAVTIAMVQTLSQKSFPQSVYDYFGMLIVDEVHIIGAPTFSSVLLSFSAGYRFGVSATPKRRDGLQKVLDHSLGRVRVYIEDEHDKSSVYVAEHDTVYSWYANTSPKMGRFISEISEDSSRNLLVAESACFLYDTGRDTLILSDRIEQLRSLKSLCYYMGVPDEDMGLYAGYTPQYFYEKEPTPMRKPEGYVKGLDYTPISLKLISKRNKKTHLAEVKTKAKIIFATYQMFSKGVDVPRLCAGVDATPRSQAEQVQGRILRKQANKARPIWITIADTASYRSLFALAGRIGDYVKNNSEISKWSPEQDTTPCNAKDLKRETLEAVSRLKSMLIETNKDGLNTLATRREQAESAMRHARNTNQVRRTRAG